MTEGLSEMLILSQLAYWQIVVLAHAPPGVAGRVEPAIPKTVIGSRQPRVSYRWPVRQY